PKPAAAFWHLPAFVLAGPSAWVAAFAGPFVAFFLRPIAGFAARRISSSAKHRPSVHRALGPQIRFLLYCLYLPHPDLSTSIDRSSLLLSSLPKRALILSFLQIAPIFRWLPAVLFERLSLFLHRV